MRAGVFAGFCMFNVGSWETDKETVQRKLEDEIREGLRLSQSTKKKVGSREERAAVL